MWDTAGQERYRSLAQMYYKNAIGACVVFDVTSRDSFEKCQQWVKELNEKAGADIRIVIVGNKIDLDDHTVLLRLGSSGHVLRALVRGCTLHLFCFPLLA